jgi:general secretion pathway protein E
MARSQSRTSRWRRPSLEEQAGLPVPQQQVRSSLWDASALSPSDNDYVIKIVDLILDEAILLSASDIHLLPLADGMEVRYRIDGVLQLADILPRAIVPNVIGRLKVLADMVTYRTDIPQEGRLRGSPGEVEMRVSSFPTHFGERAVIRLFSRSNRYVRLGDLGLPDEIAATLAQLLAETSGAILFCGPAGSGKTTTFYTCLRELAASSRGGRSLMTLEDPIEVLIPGVAQAQLNKTAGLDLASGLRSMMRQDPEVIAVGEIRDLETAEIALQASLTGHLVLCTFHAGSAAGVLSRLADMKIEPYVMISGIRAVVCQRLVRRLCDCARDVDDPSLLLGLAVSRARVAVGCDVCRGTGYQGRVVLAEILAPSDPAISQAIRVHADVAHLERVAHQGGIVGIFERARHAVEVGLTAPPGIRRVLGISNRPPAPLA